jgi:hypothetical protein
MKFFKKLTEFVPFFFILSQYCPTVERILPDWLCLPNKLGGAGEWQRTLATVKPLYIFSPLDKYR